MTKRPTRASLTPWFPAEVKPVRKGVYLVSSVLAQNVYCRWNGSVWCGSETAVDRASKQRIPSYKQDRQWRGLAVKP